METELEQLTRENCAEAYEIQRDDVPETYEDSTSKIIELTAYGKEHRLAGHTYLIRHDRRTVGIILLGEAIPWETDPPRVKREPFYRLMGFVLDRRYRGKGIGGEALEKAIACVYRDFGIRPIVLGCHRNNGRAAAFYEKHGFEATPHMEGNDRYFLRFPEGQEP